MLLIYIYGVVRSSLIIFSWFAVTNFEKSFTRKTKVVSPDQFLASEKIRRKIINFQIMILTIFIKLLLIYDKRVEGNTSKVIAKKACTLIGVRRLEIYDL